MYRIVLYSQDSVLDQLLNKAHSQLFACKAVRNEADLQKQIDSIDPHILIVSGAHDFIQNALLVIRRLQFNNEIGLVYMAREYKMQLDEDCFLSGADHFLLQQTPFHLLESKLINLAKKIEKLKASQFSHLQSSRRELETLTVSPDKKVIKHNHKILNLSPIHHQLVLIFLAHPDRLLTREDLIQLVWKGQKISARSIDAQISKLKKAVPLFEKTITNMYGRGYIYSSFQKLAA